MVFGSSSRGVRRAEFPLTYEGVDQMSDLVQEALAASGLAQRDVLRTRLSLEEVMLAWIDAGTLEGPCELEVLRRFGRISVSLSCAGAPCDPLSQRPDDEFGNGQLGRSIMENLGLGLSWQHRDGVNVASCSLKRKRRMGQLASLGLAVALAFVCAAIFSVLPEGWSEFALNTFLDPLLDAFLGCFTCIVGPLMFLSMVWGIANIGDSQRLGTIGSSLLSRFMLVTVVYAVVVTAAAILFFQPAFGDSQGGQDVLSSIVAMLLDIIPHNIASPFLEGNTLQILFMGVAVGIAVVMMRDRVSALMNVVDQANAIVQLILGAVSSLMPVFVFTSILCLVLDGSFAKSAVGMLSAVALGASLSFSEIGLEILSMRALGVSPAKAASKLSQPFLVSLSTASSAAALPMTIDACKKKLGIDGKLVDFAAPFGTVVFMPHAASSLIVVSIFAAQMYDVELGVGAIILCVINAVVLSVAAPPIPGGALSCYTLMFMQLGIPIEALALAVAIDTVLDFVGTAGCQTDLAVQIAHGAKSLGMLDEKILKA